MFTYAVEVTRVVDGDTIDVDIDLGFDTWVRDVRLRFNRIDAFETRLGKNTTQAEKEKGLEGKAFIAKMIEENPKSVKITTTERGKFGRWIAEITVNDINLSDELVVKGYAVYKEY